jgi:hypothetical protein
LELLEDRSDSPLICQQIADALPGNWHAYCREGNDPREHFTLHSPQIPHSQLYAHSRAHATHWEWGISVLWPKTVTELPSFIRYAPIDRTKCKTAKNRTPASIAADVQRRLLPPGEQYWDQCRGFLKAQRSEWASYIDAIAELCEMIGHTPPDPTSNPSGAWWADHFEVTHGVWRVKISRYGLTYKLSRTGDVSEDLFDQLDAIEWGSGDA